jgi:hypothetical protein
LSDEDEDEKAGMEINSEALDYDDGQGAYQSGSDDKAPQDTGQQRSSRRNRSTRSLMPGSASVSFQVKGWLASGIKVEKLVVDNQRSKGLGAGVQPYKGVKYLTISKDGIEARC